MGTGPVTGDRPVGVCCRSRAISAYARGSDVSVPAWAGEGGERVTKLRSPPRTTGRRSELPNSHHNNQAPSCQDPQGPLVRGWVRLPALPANRRHPAPRNRVVSRSVGNGPAFRRTTRQQFGAAIYAKHHARAD